MPAQKARWFGGVRQVGTDLFVTVRDVDDDKQPYGSEYEVDVLGLAGPEGHKAAAAVGLNPREYETLEARLLAVRGTLLQRGLSVWSPRNARVIEHGQTPSTPAPSWVPDHEHDDDMPETPDASPEPEQEEEAMPETRPEPDPEPESDAGDLVGILNRMIRDVAGKSVDESKVRAIVADAVAESVKDLGPIVTTIHLPNTFTSVDMEGVMHVAFQDVLELAQQRMNVWMVGPAGTGKTYMGEMVAKALDLPFYSIQCNPSMPESRLTGYMDANGRYVRSLFREAFENGGIYLFDEIDNSHPSTLATVNAALANGQMAFADGMVSKHADCIVLAAANTYGTGASDQYIGRQKIDAATLNRFFKIQVDVDENVEESAVRSWLPDARADDWLTLVRRHRANAMAHNLRIIVSMRDAIDGARMLAAGWTMEKCSNTRWLAGLGADDKAKVTR